MGSWVPRVRVGVWHRTGCDWICVVCWVVVAWVGRRAVVRLSWVIVVGLISGAAFRGNRGLRGLRAWDWAVGRRDSSQTLFGLRIARNNSLAVSWPRRRYSIQSGPPTVIVVVRVWDNIVSASTPRRWEFGLRDNSGWSATGGIGGNIGGGVGIVCYTTFRASCPRRGIGVLCNSPRVHLHDRNLRAQTPRNAAKPWRDRDFNKTNRRGVSDSSLGLVGCGAGWLG